MYRVLSQDRVIDSGLFFFIHMEEILYLLTENNRMLKKICEYIKEDELNEKCDVLSRGIHTRVDIKAKKGSGEKEIIKLIRKANDLNIKYFGIDVSKNDN